MIMCTQLWRHDSKFSPKFLLENLSLRYFQLQNTILPVYIWIVNVRLLILHIAGKTNINADGHCAVSKKVIFYNISTNLKPDND